MPAETAASRTARDLPLLEKREEGWDDIRYIDHWRALAPGAVDSFGVVVTFSHEDMLRATDPRVTKQAGIETMTLRGISSGPIFDFFNLSLLFANGERHAARRGPLARAFAHPLMNALRPRIREVAQEIVRPLIGKGETDFAEAVSGPLPARMIAELLGAPPSDIPHFTQVVYGASRGLSFRSAEVMEEAERDMGELAAYAESLLAARRAAPRDDFLTDYLARTEDVELSEEELRMQVASLVLAGADTTRMALACTFAQLLHRPEQWELLKSDPEAHAKGAASEGLRFDPVVGSLPRIATEDFEIAGVTVEKGAYISPSLIGALRDPAVYAEPDVFDITREDHPRLHPVFGAGAHRCLGEALARAELEEALIVLAQEAPDAALVGEPPVLRGLGGTRGMGPVTVRF